MIVIINSKRYLEELSTAILDSAAMVFLLYGDRFDIIKNTHGKLMFNVSMSELSRYLLAAAELEKPK